MLLVIGNLMAMGAHKKGDFMISGKIQEQYETTNNLTNRGYEMRNVKRRARKASRVFPEVSGSRDSPLVLVEAPFQGLSSPLILARTKCSLVFYLLHSEAVITEPHTMPSQEPSYEAAHNSLGAHQANPPPGQLGDCDP